MNFGRISNLVLLIMFSLNLTILWGQKDPLSNPNYGVDSISRGACANDLSTMSEFMKINLPDYALPAWRNVFTNCPASSKNIYINGVKIFQEKIEKAADPVIQSAYYDTLMLIYDQRIKYFGEEGYVLGRKGKDMLRYNNKDFENGYATLMMSFQKSGIEVDPGVSVGLIETSVLMYIAGKISAKDLLNNYLSVSEINGKQINNGGKAEIAEQVYSRINSALSKAALNNCVDIEETFREKIGSGNADQRLLILVSELLQKAGCENSDFFGEINERLFSTDSTAERAYTLAWFYIKKEKFESAVSYLQKAINIEIDADKKAHYYYQLALICNTKMNMQKEAVSYAQEAVMLLPSWGEPYFVIASAYLQGSKDCFEGSFERSSVYWVAADQCIKAKSIDKSVENRADELISEYSRFFPNNEEVFFRSLQEGSDYTIGCWINEKTRVRIRK